VENLHTNDFDYFLPQELIAQKPIEPRDASRLMVLDRQNGSIEHRNFSNLADFLRAGDVMVFNDSRVIPARLFRDKDKKRRCSRNSSSSSPAAKRLGNTRQAGQASKDRH